MKCIISTVPKGYIHQVLPDLCQLFHFAPRVAVDTDTLLAQVFSGRSVLWGIFEPNSTKLVGFIITTKKAYPEGFKLFIDRMYTPKTHPEAAAEAFKILSLFQYDSGCISVESTFGSPLHEHYKKEELGGCVYGVEPYLGAKKEAQELMLLHFEEVATNKDSFKLNMDDESYEDAEEIHNLHAVTCRKDGKLIGYHVSFVRPHLHYKDSLTAYVDLFFIHPEHRKGRVGINLFKYAEKTLWHRGVQRIYMPTKLKLDVGALFERLGFTAIERVYTKVRS